MQRSSYRTVIFTLRTGLNRALSPRHFPPFATHKPALGPLSFRLMSGSLPPRPSDLLSRLSAAPSLLERISSPLPTPSPVFARAAIAGLPARPDFTLPSKPNFTASTSTFLPPGRGRDSVSPPRRRVEETSRRGDVYIRSPSPGGDSYVPEHRRARRRSPSPPPRSSYRGHHSRSISPVKPSRYTQTSRPRSPSPPPRSPPPKNYTTRAAARDRTPPPKSFTTLRSRYAENDTKRAAAASPERKPFQRGGSQDERKASQRQAVDDQTAVFRAAQQEAAEKERKERAEAAEQQRKERAEAAEQNRLERVKALEEKEKIFAEERARREKILELRRAR